MSEKPLSNAAAPTPLEDNNDGTQVDFHSVSTRLSLEANQLEPPSDKKGDQIKPVKEKEPSLILTLPDVFKEIDKASPKPGAKDKVGDDNKADGKKPTDDKKLDDKKIGAMKVDDKKVDDKKSDDKAEKGEVAAKPKKVVPEGDGSILVNGAKVESGVATKHETKVVTEDGTFVRDDKNRIISSESADGKTKRTFDYDPKEPNKLKSVTINGTRYDNIGAIKYSKDQTTVTNNGEDMYSWSMYDEKGAHKGGWFGSKTISPDGVFKEVDHRTDKVKFEDVAGKELTKEEADKRNASGIWPSTVAITRPDGSKIDAQLKGKTVESLKETRSEDGKEVTVNWTKKGDTWVSDEKPARERTNVSLKLDGDLSYKTSDGVSVVEAKNSEKTVTKDGVTDKFNRNGDRVKVDTADGSRQLDYKTDAKDNRVLSEIKTKSGDKESKWTKKGDTDEWVSADGKSEIRKNLKVLDNGNIEFTDKDGKKVRETIASQRINYDDSNRPALVTFPSGATRTFDYDKEGLKSIKDHIPTKEGTHDIEWSRDGEKFVSKREGGKTYTRDKVSVTDDADVNYVGTDKKPHTAKVRDIDKIANGEFVMGSESLLEARDKLNEAVKNSGLDQERFNKWLKEFEANAGKNKLPPEKVVRTMNNLADILVAKDKSPHFDAKQKETLVDTAMHNLARPLEIDQGSHPTCNVTSVEVWAAVKHPDQYTRLLKEVALSGKWTTSEGKKFEPTTNYKGRDPEGTEQVYNSIKPGKDETKYDLSKPDSGDRNLASQVLQMTLINAMYEHGHMNKTDDKGKVLEDRTNMRYVMGPNRTKTEFQPGGIKTVTDLGEDLLMKDGKPVLDAKGQPTEGGPGMVQDHVIKSGKLLTGEEPPHIKCTGWYDDPQTGQKKFTNDLIDKERLLDIKKKGDMPILTPTMGGAHSQTIHDVWEDPKDGKVWVLLDNQHGEPEVKGADRKSGEGDGDGWITLDALHKTLKSRDQGGDCGRPVMPTVHKYSHPRDRK
ncbi:MAG: hypothetical protein K2X93_03510 [Candidatus Obscuribacterales bacterium]|nr:hypothetical protein [Candidatus Obscuribacterales bacterium]